MKKGVKVIFLILISIKTFGQGNLLVFPTRITFDDNKRKQILDLVNQGKDTVTYSLSFLHFKMTEDGKLLIIDKQDSLTRFADQYLRVFPRKIRLGPKEKQTISIQYTKKSGMLPGEYRSHIYFKEETEDKPLNKEEKDTTRTGVIMKAVVSLSIPIVIQTGSLYSKPTLSDLSLGLPKDTIQEFTFILHREGNASVYGDLIAEHSPEGGKPKLIGTLKGVGVYTNIDKRYFLMKIKIDSGVPLKKGKIKLYYRTRDDIKPVLLTEKEYLII